MQYNYFVTQARQLTNLFYIISFLSQNRKDDFGKSKGRLQEIERTTLGNRKDDLEKSKGRLQEIERTTLGNRKDDFRKSKGRFLSLIY